MGSQITIEVCLDSLASARVVQKVSAEFQNRVKWRIELCSNLIHGGGMTPSIGLVRSIRKFLPNIEIMIMIRPRIGSFTYTEDEIETMVQDILALKSEGVTGFVFGCLLGNNTIDLKRLKVLCEAAGRYPTTFHRAFDLVPDPSEAYDSLSQPDFSAISRILTSGQSQTAPGGLDLIDTLMSEGDQGHTRPSILPGSGLNPDNLPDFLRQLPDLKEIHLTASHVIDNPNSPRPNVGFKLGFGDNKVWVMNEDKLRAVFKVIDDLAQE